MVILPISCRESEVKRLQKAMGDASKILAENERGFEEAKVQLESVKGERIALNKKKEDLLNLQAHRRRR